MTLHNKINMIGKRFGMLTALKEVERGKKNGICRYLFLCKCGNEKEILGTSVRSGYTKSCGCLLEKRKANMISKRFGRLVAIKEIRPPNPGGPPYYIFQCDCKKKIATTGKDVRAGRTQSCGCLRRQVAKAMFEKHGHAANGKTSQEYRAWQSMLSRCRNPNNKHYFNYGGRGIVVCRRWSKSFISFLSDMGTAPSGTTLDRKNNNKGYTPNNCRWATRNEQSRNRRNNVLITHDGKTMALTDWEHHYGFRKGVLGHRMNHQGLSFEQAIAMKLHSKNREH